MGDFFGDRLFRLIISQSHRAPTSLIGHVAIRHHIGAPRPNAVSSRASSCAPSLPLPTTQQPQFCLSVRIPWTLRIRKWRRRLPLRWRSLAWAGLTLFALTALMTALPHCQFASNCARICTRLRRCLPAHQAFTMSLSPYVYRWWSLLHFRVPCIC